VIETFRKEYPEDGYPHLTTEKQTLLLKKVQCKPPQCSVIVPTQEVHLTDDTPLLCSFDVWSTWPRLLITFGIMGLGVGGMMAGLIIPQDYSEAI